jgi:hypothetical protein
VPINASRFKAIWPWLAEVRYVWYSAAVIGVAVIISLLLYPTEPVRATYEAHEDEGIYVPLPQTEWTYRCVFSQGLMEDLAGLLEKHNFEEILKHLYLHKGKEPLLLWHN